MPSFLMLFQFYFSFFSLDFLSTVFFFFFFFNDTATTEIYTLSLHDALPIYQRFPLRRVKTTQAFHHVFDARARTRRRAEQRRSEEHTSELQSQSNLVCRLLLEKKKKKKKKTTNHSCATLHIHVSRYTASVRD